jgi:hypothetical protein
MSGAALEHLYLLREGTWWVVGEFTDASGRASAVRGETLVRHLPGLWICESVLAASAAAGARVAEHRNRCEIVPFAAGSRATHWSSQNSTVGMLNGRFVLSGDSILSFCASPTARYRGVECLIRLDETRYAARGTFLEEDRVLSTWSLELERQHAAPRRVRENELSTDEAR